MLNVYADNFPQEKVYVHFDKNIYNPGETIWFKAYLFSGAFPSPISKNFYFELSDADGNLLQRKVAPLFESTAAGNFDLPKKLKGGHVHFRAYSAWMLNFDTSFVYEKDIRVINPGPDSSGKAAAPERHLKFFPEGGYIISGLENNIAFEATDQSGLPVPVKGAIRDLSGKEVASFSSLHDGMGSFLLIPEKNDSLYAIWSDDQGREHSTPLPAIKSSGALLRLIPASKKVLFSVSRASEGQGSDQFIIMANMHQHLIYKAKINLHDDLMSGGAIPVDQLPSGILQVTLFTSAYVPVAERVVFVNNHEFEIGPGLVFNQKNIGRRGKNVIEIDIPDTLRSNFSLAVTDALADGITANGDNIVSRLLFTGDLKGAIHDPFYYFSNTSDSTAHYLDLVMLTHGWRRIKWDQLARGAIPIIKFADQDRLALNVQVFGIDPSHIAKEETLNVILRKKDSSTQILQIPHLSGGKFVITGLIFYDTVKAFYQFNVNRRLSTEAAVTFNTGLMRQYRKIRPLTVASVAWGLGDSSLLLRNRFIAQETLHNNPEFTGKVKVLEAVTVHGREKTDAQKLDELYASGMFSGGGAYAFDFTKDPFAQTAIDVFSYLQGKIAGLIINNTGSSTSLQWRGGTPTLFLNEMQVDASSLKSISSSDIAYVKVFRPGESGIIGAGGGGAIAVYTRRGSEARNNNNMNIQGLETTQLIGYSVSKEFYSPDYSKASTPVEAEDTRSTLLWVPYILTDKENHKMTLVFYNNDITKVIRVVLEGFNEDGKLARVEKIIQ